MIEDKFFLSKTDFDFLGKTVLVRFDCDVDLKNEDGRLVVDEDFRLRQAVPTIKFLLEKGVEKIILLGHLDRPEGRVVEALKLRPVAEWFCCHSELSSRVNPERAKRVEGEIEGSLSYDGKDQRKGCLHFSRHDGRYQIGSNIFLVENLRFDKREEGNDEGFAKELAGLGDVYINDAFGVSHRKHTSIVGIPKFLPSFLGLNFEKEMEVLGKLREKAKRPLVFVLGGSKKDKLDYLEFLGEWCDTTLVGGKLPLLINESFVISHHSDQAQRVEESLSSNDARKGSLDKLGMTEKFFRDDKIIISNLKSNGRDIDDESVEKFKEIIKTAGTLVFAGPMGVYEERENQKGTFEVAKAIAESSAYKVAGGGDTHRILSRLNLWDKFDFVSSGGGAMLAFLKDGSLEGIRAMSGEE